MLAYIVPAIAMVLVRIFGGESMADAQPVDSRREIDASLYRLMVEAVTDYAIFLLDSKGRILCWNTGAKLMLGYQETEIFGQHYSRFFTPADIQNGEPEKDLMTSAAQGTARESRWHVRADGTRFWCHGTITAVRDNDGTLCGFTKVVRDLTGQHWL